MGERELRGSVGGRFGFVGAAIRRLNRFSIQHRSLTTFLLTSLFIFYCLNLRFIGLRFSHTVPNQIFAILCLTTPTLLLFHLLRNSSAGAKLIWAIICGPIVIVTWILAALGAMIAASTIGAGVDFSYEPINTLELEHSCVRAYRTNGGATTDFGIVVRQEMTVIPGLRLVDQFYDEYHKYDVDIVRSGPNEVTIEGEPYTLKPYIYF